MASDSRDRRWAVTYSSSLPGLAVIGAPGSLLLRHEAARWVLFDERNSVIDARCLHEGEEIADQGIVIFPAHVASIVSAVRVEAAATTPTSPARADRVGGSVESNQRINGGFGPSGPTSDRGLQDQVGIGASASLHHSFHLDSLLSHLWSDSRVSGGGARESFEWWTGKVGGDPRSYSQVVASPGVGVSRSASANPSIDVDG
jgi:hypothetical protein